MAPQNMDFMEEVAVKLERGEETIGAGMAADIIGKWHAAIGDMLRDAIYELIALKAISVVNNAK
ncbi:hypothetical protein F4809DRAFT_645690 [Biscogniauxia mediterranea]|nr:hypothetical protein F4809DRAFT_645690 [Biscogniauxia mediterranea]